MNFRMRISDIFGLKQARFLSLLAAAALSWVSGSGFPEAVMTDEQGVLVGEFVQSAAAADTPAAKAGPAAEKSAGDAAATTVNGIIQLVMMLFLPATILAGWLLSPDWTFGEIFGLRPIIHNLWVLVSNVVYV
ncbi:MAG: hypothetical protein QG650_1015, partial [Patescibacteria group bacterium]|nr:hypothetical protein [Patescibacteria group bacterium]